MECNFSALIGYEVFKCLKQQFCMRGTVKKYNSFLSRPELDEKIDATVMFVWKKSLDYPNWLFDLIWFDFVYLHRDSALINISAYVSVSVIFQLSSLGKALTAS